LSDAVSIIIDGAAMERQHASMQFPHSGLHDDVVCEGKPSVTHSVSLLKALLSTAFLFYFSPVVSAHFTPSAMRSMRLFTDSLILF
jgi:hypothetical protein